MKSLATFGFYLAIAGLLLILIFQIGFVQTFFSKKLLESISEKTGSSISVEKMKVTWLDRAKMDDLLILDSRKDTLIYAEDFKVNYRLADLLRKDFLNVQKISSSKVKVNLIKHDSLSSLNLIELLNSLKSSDTTKKSKTIRVEEISFSNFEFSLNDKTKLPVEGRLDLAHIEMRFPDFQISDLKLIKDSVTLDIVQIAGREKNVGLQLNEFSGNLMLNSQSLELTDLVLKTPTSQVSDSIKLYYNGLASLSSFVDSVSFAFYLSDTQVSQKDLQLIIGPHGLESAISFDGVVWGTVGDFNVEQSRIGFGQESFIQGGVSCFGLPNLKSSFVLADITDSHIVTKDIEPYVGEISQNVAQLGRLDFTGSFAGFLNDFVARGDFVTEKGSVHSDINIKIPDNPNRMSYSGHIELKDVDLGAFFDTRELVQNVNLKGKINGSGLTRDNANFNLNAMMTHSGFNGYVYDTIRANGVFASRLFKGSFSIEDPNSMVKGFADLDLNSEAEHLVLDLHVESVDLQKTNLSKDSIRVSGDIAADVINLDIDEAVGEVLVKNALIKLDEKQVLVDSLKLVSVLNNKNRSLELAMPGLNAELKGRFDISDALKDLSAMAADYNSKIRLLKDSVERERSGETYTMDFFAGVSDVSQYLDSLDIPLQIAKETIIEATFRESKSANIFFYTQSDFVNIGNVELIEPSIEINGSKENDSDQILTNFIIQSEEQRIAGIPETNDLLVEGIWFDNKIDITSSISQEGTDSDIRVESSADLTADSINVSFDKSRVVLFGDEWGFRPDNLVTIYPEEIRIKTLEVHDITESVELKGVMDFKEATNLDVVVNDLQLEKVNLFTDADVDGLLNGDFTIFRDSSDNAYQFDGGFLISELKLDDFLVGDIAGISELDPSDGSIYAKVDVDRENFRSIDLEGRYYPSREIDQLDFRLNFDRADIRMAQPFLQDNVTNLAGFAKGEINITGSFEHPEAIGDCVITDGKMTVNYLNTTYEFHGNIKSALNELRFENFDLTDRKGEKALVQGTISHDYFKNIVTHIELRANNFEFLNTTSVDNSLYYGSANGTGVINVSGPFNDLLIKANVRTEKDTRFFVPISEGGDISQQEYIAFVNFNDSTVVEKEEFTFQGLTLEFDIDVTPDAYCELIFDIKTGDIIRGRGRGNIKLNLNTDGEFNMFGPLEITEGAYNFTVPGFINKEFQVNPGSRITWFGDPYNGTIDLEAIYLQRASFAPLAEGEGVAEGVSESEVNERVGIDVMLSLNGGMLSPEIDFDLQTAAQADVGRDWRNAILTQIKEDEQELRRQVISLLFLKKFSPKSSFAIGGGGNIGNSVSEFLSSQVSYLVSQLDENLEVEVDLTSLDKEAFNTFQLRLAYTFLDGRLKVTRGGGFRSDQDTNDTVLDDIIGDWSVEYTLTKDGRLRAKAFQSSNQLISTSGNQEEPDRGISLMFIHSFNEFRDLLSTKRNEAINRKAEDQPVNKSISQSNDISTY